MRYIESIEDPGVSWLVYNKGTLLDEHDGSALYNWLCRRSVLSDSSRFLGKGDDVAGVGFNPVTCSYGAVVHTKKTFKLYDYIDATFMIMNEKPQVFETCDSYTICDGKASFQKRYDILDIDLDYLRTGLFGDGTIVGVKDNLFHGGEMLFSLYDFLVFICKQTHINLMQYNIVQFKNSTLSRYIQIWFKHSVEADRFFTKMLLDVVK